MMKRPLRYIAIALFAFLSIATFISCPAAPPVDPIDEYNPNGAPAGPKNVKATNGYEGTITLTWDPVDNATSYQIWMIESSEYGAISNDEEITSTRSELEKRGFKHVDDVDSATTEYILKLSGNKAYVFSIIAIRNMAEDGAAANLVYSAPSQFVEGSTLQQLESITLTGIGSASEIRLYWDVPNIFSVLTEDKTPLYDYSFKIEYKKQTDDATGWKTAAENYKEFNKTLSQGDFGFDPDTYYDFRVTMSIKDGTGAEINTPTSRVYPVLTDSNLTLQPMRSVTVTQGTEVDGVKVSWVYPAMPSGVNADKAYQVERREGKDGNWTVVLAATDEYVTTHKNETSWTDTSAEDNKQYYYRVRFGYIDNNAPLMQSDSDKITEATEQGWKLWRPTDIRAVMSKSTDNALSGTVTISWTYNKPEKDAAGEVSWKLVRNTWDQTSGTSTDSSEDIPLSSTSSYSHDDPITIESGYQIYTYELEMIYGNTTLNFAVDSDTTLSLGESAEAYIENLQATTDMVGFIQLSWIVENGKDANLEYSYYIDSQKDPISLNDQIIRVGNTNHRSAIIEINDEKEHVFRLSLNGITSPETTTGRVLASPTNLKASDGLSNNSIELTYDPVKGDLANIELIVEQQQEGEWVELPQTSIDADLSAGTASLTDIEEKAAYGTVHNFRIALRNSNQDKGVKTNYSNEDTGNILGGAGLSISAEQYIKKDSYQLSWSNASPAVGATGYRVYARVKDSGADYQRIMGTGVITINDTGVSISYDNVLNYTKPTVSTESYTHNPLSVMYEFKLVPVNGNIEADIESAPMAEGILFCPPADVSATKAESTGVVTVSWEPVENAEKYYVYRYEEGGNPNSATLISSDCKSTSYQDSTTDGKEYYYTVAAVKTADGSDYSSIIQDGFDMLEENMYKEVEAANKGYILDVPEIIDVESVTGDDRKYEPYVKIRWKRSHGATSYMLTNSILSEPDAVINVNTDDFDYSLDTIASIGSADNAGYLSYDPETKYYTYYDGRGVRRDTLNISNYKLIAINDNAQTIADEDGNNVTRALKAEEYVNLVNGMIQPILQNFDEKTYDNESSGGGGKLKHDWWLYSFSWSPNHDYTKEEKYANETAIIHLHSNYFEGAEGAKEYIPINNYMYLNSFKNQSLGITLTTTNNIQFDIDKDSGNTSKVNYLDVIGFDGNGTVRIVFDNTCYSPANLTYQNIKVRDYSGKYIVTIDGKNSETVDDSSEIVRPFISPR